MFRLSPKRPSVQAGAMFEYHAIVVSIHDADTIRANIKLGFSIWTDYKPIRLSGIDAPELGTPEGRLARDFLRWLIPLDSEVILITPNDDADKYGRYLADIYIPTEPIESVNAMLVRLGYARPYDGGAR
jgi:endonuclease YncB( thermonuclease family)